MVLRLTAAIPATASTIVFALAIVLLAAGSDPSSANNDYWVALNASGAGGNLVTVGPADSSTSSDPFGAIISSIPGLEPILDNVTQGLGNGLSDAQGQIVGSLVSGLGIKDFYFLYVSKMCEGSLRSNDANSGVNIDKCYSYHDGGTGLLNISNSIPSSVTIANAQVSVPLVESLQSTLKSIVNLAVGSSTTMMVFLIIACVAAGFTAIGSVLGIIRAKSRILIILNLGFSTLAATLVLSLAVIATAVIFAGKSLIGGIGSGFSLNVQEGASFVAIVWVAAVLGSIAGLYWFGVWFVEFRKTSFSRRSRTAKQIGNWRGIFNEVRRDFKTDGHGPPSVEYGEGGSPKA